MLIRFAGILWPLQLNFQPLGTDLEAVHCLDRALGGQRVVIADESETLAEIRVLVDENF